MTAFRTIHWSSLDSAPVEGLPAPFFCVWPEPVDHDLCFEEAGFTAFADSDAAWDADLSQLVDDLLSYLGAFGKPCLIRGDLPVKRRFLRSRTGSIADALVCAATDDQFQGCLIGFGKATSTAIAASDGHPIFWLGGLDSLNSLLTVVARGRECAQTTLTWSAIWPSRKHLTSSCGKS